MLFLEVQLLWSSSEDNISALEELFLKIFQQSKLHIPLFDETSTIKGYPLRIHITTFEAAVNLRRCSKAKTMINLLLNWVSAAVFLCHHGKKNKNQASLCYEQAKSPAAFSMLSIANLKNQETLKSAVCFEPPPCLYC